ncbi:hypothetical protein BFP70_14595 [Thioclava sp. SK-1]|uniref:DUF2291 family protein n=1 Tax=Thioclava sp. SK-1 TaxID=1889770 RepID=UPI00082493A8|nr:DUF2291 domain-containing protein [Thioclava sp. SK-1]OCX61715.1 hypothetical protein BFP70_14595 [Thioclava sp. SK-1]
MTLTATARPTQVSRRKMIAGAALITLIGAIALDTKIVTIGGEDDLRQQAFNPDLFGAQEFPRIRDIITQQAADASTLMQALHMDKAAAIAKYGTMTGAFPVLSVSVTGTVAPGKSGIFPIVVHGLPKDVKIRLQTGPAINGTELRDAVGDIAFGAFKNQIEFQDAGAGINRAMSAAVLTDLDRAALPGRTVSATGAFTMINPKSWLITPVSLLVKG